MEEWSSCSSTIFILLSFLMGTIKGDFATGAMQAIRCTLSQTAPLNCSTLPEVAVPSYLVQAYNDCPSSIHTALSSGQLRKLSNAQMAYLPLSLLYLIPRGRLSELKGTQIASIIQMHVDDTSLAEQMAASLQHEQDELLRLLHKLNVSTLSQEVQKVLGKSIGIADLNMTFLNTLLFNQGSTLAYLRPNVLFKLDVRIFYKVLFHLNELEINKLPSRDTISIIAKAAIKHKFPLSNIKWMVMGFTPDELKNYSMSLDLSTKSFRFDLTKLQARVIFEHVFHNKTLQPSHFMDCNPVLPKLSPTLLQRFPAIQHKYNTMTKLPSPMSLPTAYQITEYVKSYCKLTGGLPKDDEKWGSRIRYLGPWVYTLPLSALQEYLSGPLGNASLQAIETPALSPLQTYYLTGRGESLNVRVANSVLGLDTFLHALPACQLVSHKLGEISSHVMDHLVANLPADNLPRTLSLVHKMSSSIGEQFILDSLFINSDVNKIMALVSPKDIQASAARMLKIFSYKQENRPIVQQLPSQVLAALLEQVRNNKEWNWQNMLDNTHVSQLLVGGLTCQHIEDMDTGLFIPIMALYNRQRKQGFPKNLQHCCLQKLISHLQLKMALTQTDPNYGLISILEPIEIESVGGYVLAGLPVEVMKESPYLGYILAAIGKLSSSELLMAADMSHIQAIAQLAVDKEGNVDVFLAGNLSWFLPLNTNIPELKLILESGLLDTTICLPAESRRYIAVNLISEFGLPGEWSAGVLATLQDLLLVFTMDELLTVSKTAWIDAADSLTSHYSDDIVWIEPTPFYQVCSKILGKSEENDYKLSLARLARFLLRAAQWELNTVQQNISYSSNSKPTIIQINSSSEVLNPEQNPDLNVDIFSPEIEEEIPSTTLSSSKVSISSLSESTTDKYITISSTESRTAIDTSSSTTDSTTTQDTTSSTINFTTLQKTTKSSTTTQKPSSYTTSSTTTEGTERLISEGNESTTKSIDGSTIDGTNRDSTSFLSNTTTNQDTTISAITLSKLETITNSDITQRTLSSSTQSTVTVKIESSIFDEGKHTTKGLNSSNSSRNNVVIEKGNVTDEFTTTSSHPTERITSNPTTRTENEIEDEIIPSIKNNISTVDGSLSYSMEDNTTHTSNRTEEFSKGMVITTKSSLTDDEFGTDEEEQPFGRENFTKPSDLIKPQIKVSEFEVENGDTYSKTSVTTPIKENISKTELLDESDLKNNSTESVNNKMYWHNTPSINSISSDISYETSTRTLASNDSLLINTTLNDDNENEYKYDVDESQLSIIEDDNITQRTKRSNSQVYSTMLTCNALKMVGKLAALALSETDIEEMSDTELNDCRSELGAMELSIKLKKEIWKRINKVDGVHLLGNLVEVANVGDLWDLNLNIKEPWALETIHVFIKYVNNTVVLEKLLSSVQSLNSDFPPELLAVLGGSLCTLEPESLHSLSVVGLQPWKQCPTCLPQLAEMAVKELGPVSIWSPHYVHALNGIVAGLTLEDWRALITSSNKPLTALQPLAARCLNVSYLQLLSANQIKMIPTMTLRAFSQEQISSLSEDQVWVLGNASKLKYPERMTPNKDILRIIVPSAGSYNAVITVNFKICLSLILILNFVQNYF